MTCREAIERWTLRQQQLAEQQQKQQPESKEKIITDPAQATHLQLQGQLPPIARLDSTALNQLVSCQQLSLSSNSITTMISFGGLKQLRILSLGRNNIKKLQYLDEIASSLEQLWISYNLIEQLVNGSGLDKCMKLTHLYISNNKIAKLQELTKISHLPLLSDLILTGNPCCNEWEPSDLRLQVLHRLPQLQKLDGFPITERERLATQALTNEEVNMTPFEFNTMRREQQRLAKEAELAAALKAKEEAAEASSSAGSDGALTSSDQATKFKSPRSSPRGSPSSSTKKPPTRARITSPPPRPTSSTAARSPSPPSAVATSPKKSAIKRDASGKKTSPSFEPRSLLPTGVVTASTKTTTHSGNMTTRPGSSSTTSSAASSVTPTSKRSLTPELAGAIIFRPPLPSTGSISYSSITPPSTIPIEADSTADATNTNESVTNVPSASLDSSSTEPDPITTLVQPSHSGSMGDESSVTPPAERLVGIELNPGPVDPTPVLAPNSVPSTDAAGPTHSPVLPSVVTAAASHLFTDGLLSIFQYLPLKDLLLGAVVTCHYWYSIGLKEKGRAVYFSVDVPVGQPSTELVHRHFVCLLHSPFQYHVVSILGLSLHDIRLIQPGQLPRLRIISCYFDGRSGDGLIPPSALFSSSLSPQVLSSLSLTLPNSLTSLIIVIKADCIDTTAHLYQSFLSRVSTSGGPVITNLTLWSSHQVDLSSCSHKIPLTSFSLHEHVVRFGIEPYLPFLISCSELTSLDLDFAHGTLMDIDLCRLLPPLHQLDRLTLNGLETNVFQNLWGESFHYLPPHTKIGCWSCFDADQFLAQLLRSERVQILEIDLLTFDSPLDNIEAFDVNDDYESRIQTQFERTVAQMKQLKQITVGQSLVKHWLFGDFNYPPPSSGVDDEPPAKPLVGIELNPGPTPIPTPNSVSSTCVLLTTVTAAPQLTAQTLFIDGILSIFSWLKLSDLLPALHSCHYWYACGQKERSRQVALYCWNENESTHWLSAFKSPIGANHIGEIKDFFLGDQFSLLSDLHQLSHLTTFGCSFNKLSVSKTDDSDSRVNQLIPTTTSFPMSLTHLDIFTEGNEESAPHDLCQSFINIIPNGSNIEYLRFASDLTFDLSSLTQLSRLTSLDLYKSPFPLADQRLCASLSLQQCDFQGLQKPDWTIFHPHTPFMLHIENWWWKDWEPTTDDWNYLSTHPPVMLHTLQVCVGRLQPPIDITSLPSLTHLTLDFGFPLYADAALAAISKSYVPVLSACTSLVSLKLYGPFLTDDDLCQILRPLTLLQQFDLSLLQTIRFSTSLEVTHTFFKYLPTRAYVSATITIHDLAALIEALTQNTRVEWLRISELTIQNLIHTDWVVSDLKSQFDQLVRAIPQLNYCWIDEVNGMRLHYEYTKDAYDPLGWQQPHLSGSVKNTSDDESPDPDPQLNARPVTPPPKPLVGIELNPGPVDSTPSLTPNSESSIDGGAAAGPSRKRHLSEVRDQSAASPAASLYRDVLHHIFQFLDLTEFVHACVVHGSWYSAGRTMKPREAILDYKERPIGLLIQSPLRIHISGLQLLMTTPTHSNHSGCLSLLRDHMPHLDSLVLSLNLTKQHLKDSPPSPTSFWTISKHLRKLTIRFECENEFYNMKRPDEVKPLRPHLFECVKQIAAQATGLVSFKLFVTKVPGVLDCPTDLCNLSTLTELAFSRQFSLTQQIDLIKSLPSLLRWTPCTDDLNYREIQLLADGVTSPLEDIGNLFTVDEPMATQLKRLPTLTKLNLTWVRSLGDATVFFSAFPRLKILHLICGTSVDIAHLSRALVTCITVTDLLLSHQELTSDHLCQFLPHLKSLEALILDRCPSLVSCQFLAHSKASLAHLRVLKIWHSNHMPNKEYDHLHAISSSLQSLSIENSSTEPFDPLTVARWTPGSSEFSRSAWPVLKEFTLEEYRSR